MSLVRLSFEVETLGRKIAGMVCDDADRLEGEIRNAFDRLKEQGELQRIIESAVRDELYKVVVAAMSSREVTDALAKRLASFIHEDTPHAD